MARLLAALAVVLVVIAGVWVTGGLITDNFTVSALLSGVFMCATAVAIYVIARRRPDLRWWLVGAFLLTAGGLGSYLAYSTFKETTVNERLVAGPAMLEGTFVSGEHHTAGMVKVVKGPDGKRVVTLSGFDTSPGPDLRVRYVPGETTDGGADGAVDLGALKGNRGNQQYTLPDDAPDGPASLIIWCRAFSAEFGTANLS